MPVTRDNHYVPQWYQRQFLVDGRSKLSVLDKTPPTKTLADGRVVQTGRSVEDKGPVSAFFEVDLYSTFFGTAVNDEIERKLFGDIDRRGAHAVRAFSGDDEHEWHQHFEDLFEFLDIQKLRTPKGLAWLGLASSAVSGDRKARRDVTWRRSEPVDAGDAKHPDA